MNKELIEKAYALGLEAYNQNIHIPAFNKDLMGIMPNCSPSDSEIMELRIKMLKSYSKGYSVTFNLETRKECELLYSQ